MAIQVYGRIDMYQYIRQTYLMGNSMAIASIEVQHLKWGTV
jgi:hypothetical protein